MRLSYAGWEPEDLRPKAFVVSRPHLFGVVSYCGAINSKRGEATVFREVFEFAKTNDHDASVEGFLSGVQGILQDALSQGRLTSKPLEVLLSAWGRYQRGMVHVVQQKVSNARTPGEFQILSAIDPDTKRGDPMLFYSTGSTNLGLRDFPECFLIDHVPSKIEESFRSVMEEDDDDRSPIGPVGVTCVLDRHTGMVSQNSSLIRIDDTRSCRIGIPGTFTTHARESVLATYGFLIPDKEIDTERALAEANFSSILLL